MSLYPDSIVCTTCLGLTQYAWADRHRCRCPDQHDAHVSEWVAQRYAKQEAALFDAMRNALIEGRPSAVPIIAMRDAA